MPQYDNFTTPMSAGDALNKINGMMDSVVGHSHDPAAIGNGAKIPTTALSGSIATSVLSGNIATSMLSGNIVGTVISGPVAAANNVIENGTGTLTVYKKVINIGDWNMNTTDIKVVSHSLGASWNKVVSIQVMILNDSGNIIYPLNTLNSNGDFSGGVNSMDSTTISLNLNKSIPCQFDSAEFNATSYNRGYITIEYTS